MCLIISQKPKYVKAQPNKMNMTTGLTGSHNLHSFYIILLKIFEKITYKN